MGFWNGWVELVAVRRSRAARFLWIVAVLFLAVGIAVLTRKFQPLDLAISRELQETNAVPLNQMMIGATYLGNSVTLIGLVLLLGGILWANGLRRMAGFLVCTLFSLPIDLVLKDLWERARPSPAVIHVLVVNHDYSFPSGHSLGSATVYGFLAFLVWVHVPKGVLRIPLAAFLGSVPLVVATSRVYLGEHWMSDVIGGLAVGTILVVVLATLYRARPVEAVRGARRGAGAGA